MIGAARAVSDVLMYQPDFVGIDFSVNDDPTDFFKEQVIAKLAVLVRNLEPKQGRIRAEHEFWNEKWIIGHFRRTLISYGLYESGKS